MSKRRHKPGSSWRVLAHGKHGERHEMQNKGTFDELCVDQWLRVEQMAGGLWWMQVGQHVLWVNVGKDGKADSVRVSAPGEFADVGGMVQDPRDPRAWRRR